MGEIADEIADWGYAEYESIPYNSRKTKEKFQPDDPYAWKTGNGDVLNMWEMKDYHINNCLRFLTERGSSPKKRQEFQQVLNIRAERGLNEGPPESKQKSNPWDLDDEIPF